MKYGICFVMSVFMAFASMAQPPVASFTLPANGCIGQDILVTNQSSQATRYEWDVCQGDLELSPSGSTAGVVTGSFIPSGFDIVSDGTAWYAFVASRETNSIIRVSMGADLQNFDSITDLGNPGSVLHRPVDIKVVYDNGKWYGFVFSEDHPDIITRLDFGTSLTNAPTGTVVLHTSANHYTGNQGLDMVLDGSIWYIVYTLNSSIGVVRLSSVESIPGIADQLVSTAISGGPSLGDVTILRDQGNFYAYSTSYGTPALYRFAFGTDLLTDPVQSDLSSILPTGGLNYYGISGANDGGSYYLVSSTLIGNIVVTKLGPDLSQPPVSSTAIGNAGVFGTTVKNLLVKNKTDWFNFGIDYSGGKLFKAAFPSPNCQLSPGLFTTTDLSAKFSGSGTKYISLRSFNGGAFDDSHGSIDISTLSAPVISWTNHQICAQFPVLFDYSSDAPVTSQNWDFGDGQNSIDASPQHTFTAGSYDVSLEVTAQNGCINTSIKNLKLYDPPTASFTIPGGLICSNNQLLYVDQTNDNFEGNLSYQWTVDGNPTAVTRDLSYTFLSPGDHVVKLAVSIPGCSDEQTQTITNVLTGPTASFTSSGICEGLQTTFTNQASGDIAGYHWDFGNSQTATSINPTEIFAKGTWSVTLDVTSNNGCVATARKDLNIYSVPNTSFSLDLPPFSCSGTPSQFHDTTPSMTDSNIQSWNWTFGDNGSGTGKNPVHTYTNAGPYTVRLTTTTDRGCSNFVDQQVNIIQSPIALFNNDVACVSKTTHFTDASTGNVASWQWKIGNSIYTNATPTHTFAASGNYNVQLVVTGQNNCTSSLTRQVIVPVVPALDFQVTNPCSNQTAVFNDITTNAADPISEHNWSFGTATAAGQQASYIFSDAINYNVQLAVKAQSGCSYSMTRQVAIHPSPVANFTMSDQSGPPPLRVVFTNTTTGASSYVWSFGDGSANATAASPDHTFASLGDYNVSLAATNVDGCRATASKVISVITPVVDLALEDFLLKQGAGGSYQGYVQVRNNGNYRITSFVVNYETGGGIVLSETVPSDISVGEVKTYTLGTTFNQPSASAFLCVELNPDTDDDNNKACTSLTSEPTIFTLGPNPADSFLNIESVHPLKEDIRVRLFNMQGGVAYDRTFAVDKGLSRMSLDLQNLSPGAYVVVVTSGATTSSNRLLILR